MPQGDRLQRLLRLLSFLQSGRPLDSKELSELAGVSRRTIFRDLKVLQDSGVPLQYSEVRGGFAISGSALLRPVDLTLAETLALLVACQGIGDDEKGIPFLRPARPAAMKLLGNLPGHLQDHLGPLAQKVGAWIEKRAALDHAADYFEQIRDAMRLSRPIRMKYRALTEPGRGESSFVFHPYRMLFARRTWYVIGRSSLHRGIRTFHLGRIRGVEGLDGRYRVPPRFTLERHLGNAWFLIRERGKSYRVVVKFQPLVAENVAEVVWHRTQRIVPRSDGSIDFQVTVASLKEIVWWILGYGDQAEVLEPPELRDALRRHAETMHRLYSGKQ